MQNTHFNVRHLIEVEQVEKVEGPLGFVILREAGSINNCPDMVNNLPKGSLKGCWDSNWRKYLGVERQTLF